MRTSRLVSFALASIALFASPASADAAWTIPGVVNAAGLNGTHFVSDLTVTNPGTASANVTLSFFPPGASGAKNLTLNPGQTVIYPDVAGVSFGVSGRAGALSISSDQPLLIRAKTYNTAASGTYGVALPIVASDRLLAPGDVGHSLWVSQDPSGNAGYRTNVAVVFPDDAGGEATVTVFDADGNEVGSQVFALNAPGLQQFAVGSFAGAVPVGRAQVQVIRGTAAGYSVVVDNVTGDSSLFAFEQLPVGWQDVLVNGVARANGRNAAFFRTDGRFYNPTDTDAAVTVAFHASGNANPSPQSSQFVVPAGKIRDVVDVLASLLNLPVGSAGALRFQSSSPVAILCRTSNVDPTGARPGAFGSQQKPVPLLSFVNSADAGAEVTGIRQDAAFRTNVGFAAGADGASYTLTLLDASGAAIANTAASLGAFGWTQPGIQDLFPTTTIPQNATLQVKVTAGSVDVFDSSIDNLSGDPVVTPIAPLPVAIPSSATIGPQGGSIRSDDGALTLKIPAGALGAPTPLSIATVTSDAPGALGSAYDVSPGSLALAKPALVSLRYGVAGVPVNAIGGVSLAVLADAGWGGLTGGRIDTPSRSLLVPVRNTSPWLALRGTRTTQARAGSKPTRVSPVKGIEVLAPRAGWIPTSGNLPLEVKFALPPTSIGSEVSYVPLLEQPNITVTWTRPGKNDGSLSPLNSSTTTYTAPASISDASRVVTLSVKVVASQQTYEYKADVHVIKRQWRMDFQFEVNIACAHSPYDASLSYDETHFRTMSFADDMTIKADASIPLASIGDYKFETCNPSCVLKITTPTDLLQVTGLTGYFFPPHPGSVGATTGFLVLGTVSVSKASPGYSADCMPGPDHADIPPVDYFSPIPQGPGASGIWAISNGRQSSKRLGLPIEVWIQWEPAPLPP